MRHDANGGKVATAAVEVVSVSVVFTLEVAVKVVVGVVEETGTDAAMVAEVVVRGNVGVELGLGEDDVAVGADVVVEAGVVLLGVVGEAVTAGNDESKTETFDSSFATTISRFPSLFKSPRTAKFGNEPAAKVT